MENVGLNKPVSKIISCKWTISLQNNLFIILQAPLVGTLPKAAVICHECFFRPFFFLLLLGSLPLDWPSKQGCFSIEFFPRQVYNLLLYYFRSSNGWTVSSNRQFDQHKLILVLLNKHVSLRLRLKLFHAIPQFFFF